MAAARPSSMCGAATAGWQWVTWRRRRSSNFASRARTAGPGARRRVLPRKTHLKSGERLETPETFVAVHDGDYFATLNTYRQLMAERGIDAGARRPRPTSRSGAPGAMSATCTTELIEGTLPKVKEFGLEWAVIDDGWQARSAIGVLIRTKYPNGDADMRSLVAEHPRAAA